MAKITETLCEIIGLAAIVASVTRFVVFIVESNAGPEVWAGVGFFGVMLMLVASLIHSASK